MTALDKFDRLESGGLWRDAPDAQRRDVTVSFGKATLVLSDPAGRPLTHWSLPAVNRQNPGTRPAIFAPDTDGSETLEIEDPIMIDAIEQVRKALVKSGPHPGKLRGGLMGTLLIAVVAAALFWAPGAFISKTLSVVPQSKRTEIGATVLGHYQRLTGSTCRGPLGIAALSGLHQRLFGPQASGQLVIVQDLPQGAAALPGGVIMADRQLVEQHDDPAVLAGYILAAVAGQGGQDPLADLLDQAGLRTAMTLFTTGDVPDAALRTYAAAIRDMPQTPTTPAALRAAFDAAAVPATPYLDVRQATPASYAAFEGLAPSEAPRPLMSDSDWVGLQGICAR